MDEHCVVEFKQLGATILVQLVVLNSGKLIESLEVPGVGHEGLLKAVRLGDQLLKQRAKRQKKSLPPASK